MTAWTHTVSFIIPNALQEVAKKVSRSLDPDIGGYEAFELYLSADGNQPATHVAYSTPCKESLLQIMDAVNYDNGTLHDLVSADYAARWPDERPPTAQECLDFWSALITGVDISFEILLGDQNLTIIRDTNEILGV